MRATLAPAVFKKVSQAIKNHEKIDEATADAVASAAKSWAITKGATHFTHWFQPMTFWMVIKVSFAIVAIRLKNWQKSQRSLKWLTYSFSVNCLPPINSTYSALILKITRWCMRISRRSWMAFHLRHIPWGPFLFILCTNRLLS